MTIALRRRHIRTWLALAPLLTALLIAAMNAHRERLALLTVDSGMNRAAVGERLP